MRFEDLSREEMLRRLEELENREILISAEGGRINPDILQLIFQTMTDGVVGFDGKSQIIFANPAMAMMVGQKIEAMLGKTAEEAWGEMGKGLSGRTQSTTLELEISRADGSVRLVTKKMFTLKPPAACTVAIYRDRTRRKRQEMALSRRASFYHALIEKGGMLAFVVDREGTCTWASRGALALLDCQDTDLVPKPLSDQIAPSSHGKFEALRSQALDISEKEEVCGDLLFAGAKGDGVHYRVVVKNFTHDSAVAGLLIQLVGRGTEDR